MQKEVSDSVTMCSLDSAWQSALRQRLRRRSSRFFSAKTRESTSVPHPNIRRTSECTYMSRYWGDSSSHNPLLPVFPPLTRPDVEGKGVTVSAGEAVLHISVPLMPLSSVLLQTQLAHSLLTHAPTISNLVQDTRGHS